MPPVKYSSLFLYLLSNSAAVLDAARIKVAGLDEFEEIMVLSSQGVGRTDAVHWKLAGATLD
jgi:hypothetical protein